MYFKSSSAMASLILMSDEGEKTMISGHKTNLQCVKVTSLKSRMIVFI